MENRLEERYSKEIAPLLVSKSNYKSTSQAPKIEKIVLNMGVGELTVKLKLLDEAVEELTLISGQHPLMSKAKKSMLGSRLREGSCIGAKVTCCGERMYDSLDKLMYVLRSRVCDSVGILPKSSDGRGNYTLGVREQLISPEIDYDKVNRVCGLDVVIVTTANTDEEALECLSQVGSCSL